MRKRLPIIIITSIAIATALLYVFLEPEEGSFAQKYLFSILFPLNAYLIIQLIFRRFWSVAVCRTIGTMGVLILGFAIEIMQSYGVEIFGGAYNPLDIMMYAFGVGLGFVVDVYVLDRFKNSNK
jgi:hypothetical protein